MMLANVIFPHLVGTLALRKYCPGLATGVLLLAPTTGYLLLHGYRNGYIAFPKFWLITIPFAALVAGSIPLLFGIGKRVHRQLG